jgi:hypothetical protein
VTPQAFMGSTRSSAMARSSRWWRARQELMVLDPQTSAACPRTSSDVRFSLKTTISHLGAFRWTNPNGGQNGGQTHIQAKRGGPATNDPVIELRCYDEGLPTNIGSRRCAAMLRLDAAFKAHLGLTIARRLRAEIDASNGLTGQLTWTNRRLGRP